MAVAEGAAAQFAAAADQSGIDAIFSEARISIRSPRRRIARLPWILVSWARSSDWIAASFFAVDLGGFHVEHLSDGVGWRAGDDADAEPVPREFTLDRGGDFVSSISSQTVSFISASLSGQRAQMTSICMLSGEGRAGRNGDVPCTTASSLIRRQPPQSATTRAAQIRNRVRMSSRLRTRNARRISAECHPTNEKRAA